MEAGTWLILLITKFLAPGLVPIAGRIIHSLSINSLNEWQEELWDLGHIFC